MNRAPGEKPWSIEGMRAGPIEVTRARRAAVLVALAAAVILGACGVARASQNASTAAPDPRYAGQIWKLLKEGTPLEEAVAQAGLVRTDPQKMPAWFAEEIMDPTVAASVLSDESWSVVGISMACEESEAFERMTSQLQRRGWTCVSSGVRGVATYEKEKGESTWLMMECTKMGSDASVVLHIRRG